MTAAREWYAPEQRAPISPDAERAHLLGNRVMAMTEELREVRDENTRLRQERDEYRTMLGTASVEVVRLTTLLLAAREGTR